jgi:hypothetical protein
MLLPVSQHVILLLLRFRHLAAVSAEIHQHQKVVVRDSQSAVVFVRSCQHQHRTNAQQAETITDQLFHHACLHQHVIQLRAHGRVR